MRTIICPNCGAPNTISEYDSHKKCAYCESILYNTDTKETPTQIKLDLYYEKLCTLEKNAKSQYEFREVLDQFRYLNKYKDCQIHIDYCEKKCTELVQLAIYRQAIFAMEENTLEDNDIAIAKFEQLDDYKDSADCLKQCINRIPQLTELKEAKRKEKERQRKNGLKLTCVLPTLLYIFSFYIIYTYVYDESYFSTKIDTKSWFGLMHIETRYYGSFYSDILTSTSYPWVAPILIGALLCLILAFLVLLSNFLFYQNYKLVLSSILISLSSFALYHTYVIPSGFEHNMGNASDTLSNFGAVIIFAIILNITIIFTERYTRPRKNSQLSP